MKLSVYLVLIFMSFSSMAIEDNDSILEISRESTFVSTTDLRIPANRESISFSKRIISDRSRFGDRAKCELHFTKSPYERRLKKGTILIVKSVKHINSGRVGAGGSAGLIEFKSEAIKSFECNIFKFRGGRGSLVPTNLKVMKSVLTDYFIFSESSVVDIELENICI